MLVDIAAPSSGATNSVQATPGLSNNGLLIPFALTLAILNLFARIPFGRYSGAPVKKWISFINQTPNFMFSGLLASLANLLGSLS